jgi:hypothetical protein
MEDVVVRDLGASAVQFADWRVVSRTQAVLFAGIGLGRLDIHTGAYPAQWFTSGQADYVGAATCLLELARAGSATP